MADSRGVTLVELMVALAVIGIVVTVAIVALPVPGPGTGDASDRLACLRREALARSAPARDTFRVGERVVLVTALPDGRVYGVDSGMGESGVGR